MREHSTDGAVVPLLAETQIEPNLSISGIELNTSNMAEYKPYSEQPDLHTSAPYRSAMLTYPGNLRQALKDAMADPAKTLFGVAHGIPSVFVTKLLAQTKPDFVWIDVEHGMFNRLELHE